MGLQRFERRQNAMRLPQPPQAQKAQMHADHADQAVADAQVRQHRAPRLQRRQDQAMVIQHLDSLAHQDRVAVPAQATRQAAERHRLVGRVVTDPFRRQGRGPLAEPAIDLLQGDDVGIDLRQYRQHPVGPAAPVGTDALADVVGRDLHHAGSGL